MRRLLCSRVRILGAGKIVGVGIGARSEPSGRLPFPVQAPSGRIKTRTFPNNGLAYLRDELQGLHRRRPRIISLSFSSLAITYSQFVTPSVIAIEANKVAPGLGDYYLGRTGFDAQQTEEEVPRDRPDNLFEPLPGDFGAHGVFGAQAHEKVATTWLAKHKGTTTLLGAAALGALAFVFRK